MHVFNMFGVIVCWYMMLNFFSIVGGSIIFLTLPWLVKSQKVADQLRLWLILMIWFDFEGVFCPYLNQYCDVAHSRVVPSISTLVVVKCFLISQPAIPILILLLIRQWTSKMLECFVFLDIFQGYHLTGSCQLVLKHFFVTKIVLQSLLKMFVVVSTCLLNSWISETF